jgi:hypothetical protein
MVTNEQAKRRNNANQVAVFVSFLKNAEQKATVKFILNPFWF